VSEKPYEPLLHRELHVHDVKEHFARQLSVVHDVVNYGTNLIPACFASSKRDLGDVIVITVLLKQVVMMLDAFEVLIGEACTEASTLQGRALFEASLYLDWMLSADKEKKALYYHVANVRKERQWAQRGVSDDPEQNVFFANLGNFAEAMEPTRLKLRDFAPDRLREINELLAKEPFAQANAELEKARGSRQYEPPWHKPLGEKSVRGIAKSLNRLHEYEIFYVQSSEMMHASRHAPHIKIQKGHVKLEPIRHLDGLDTILRFTLSIVFHTYRKVLDQYRPGQLTEFNARYIRDWREAFTIMPNIQYKGDSNPTLI
jgi:hypothetical protein